MSMISRQMGIARRVQVRATLLAFASLAGFVGSVPTFAAVKRSTDPYAYFALSRPEVTIQEEKKIGDSRLTRLSYLSMNGEKVPALLFLPKGASAHHKVPVVVLLHGLGGMKELMASLALYLNSCGYAAFAIDEYNHGERKQQISQVPTLQTVGMDLLTGIPQTVVDVRRAVDVLDSNPNIQQKRVGLLGVSLGAIIGTVADAYDPRFKTFVAIADGGNFATIMKTFVANHGQYVGLKNQQLSAEQLTMIGQLLKPVDPVQFGSRLKSKSVFMINGAHDRTIDPAATEQLARTIGTGTHPIFARKVIADAGHVPSPEVLNPMVRSWLAAHL